MKRTSPDKRSRIMFCLSPLPYLMCLRLLMFFNAFCSFPYSGGWLQPGRGDVRVFHAPRGMLCVDTLMAHACSEAGITQSLGTGRRR